MADPKYAGLPGIAFDQPDFYESESSDNIMNQDSISHDQSDSIEKLSTNIKDSYMKFEGHWLDSSRADFSGKISAKHHTGFRSWSGPYEIQAEGEKENPLQKLNRLKCEVAELEEELAKNNIPETEVPATETLAFQVQALQKQLMAIKIQETVGSTAPQLLGQSQNKKLAELQEAMKNTANAPKTSADATKGENGSVVYELQYKPHQVQLESACKKSDLLSRLDKLCQTLVGNHEKLERLNAETGQKSLVDIVQSMHTKLSAWDVSQIDQVDARLGVLMHKLNVISEKHLVVEDQEKLSKVKAAYEMVKKLEPLMVVLPSVVERLVALKQLHEEAANFIQSLAHIGNIQGQLEASMKSQAQLLSDIQTGLVANMGSMNEAVKHIEARQVSEKKK